MLCGEPMALSVMVTAAVSAPNTVGVKCPWMVQFAPAATLDPQVFANTNEEAPVPVRPMLGIARVALPVLVKVTCCDALSVPTFSLPNDKLVAESDTVVLNPVPLSLIDCGEPLALSVMVTAAVSAPTTVGVKCPWMVQFAPAARLDPQVFANTNEEAFAPVRLMPVIARVAPPVLVKVTCCDALVAATISLPNDKLVAESDTVVGL